MSKIMRRLSALCVASLYPVMAFAHADTETVNASALSQTPEIVACTLETGDAAQCASYVVKYLPDGLEIGPFCPATLDDVGGLWDWDGETPGLYQLDRAFFEMLSAQGYTFYDADGTVFSFDIRVEGPTAPHECINASVDETVTMTVLIPIDPLMAATPTALGTVSKVGLGIDGVPIFADAPSVLATGHMPSLDVCGGHVDPGGWYHWHATATDIETPLGQAGLDSACALTQDSSALFAYAFDGFAIYGHTDMDGTVPVDLDACGGHVGETSENKDATYHYHAAETFPNLPKCLVGVAAENNFTTTAAQGIGSSGTGGPGGPGGMPPGFEEAATSLGVTGDALFAAMEAAGGRDADLAAVAAALGVTEADLRAALPMPPR